MYSMGLYFLKLKIFNNSKSCPSQSVWTMIFILGSTLHSSSRSSKERVSTIIDEENFFIEDLINISDICIGTSSSGIVRQAVHQNKNVLQMFHNESYMLKLNQKVTIDNYFKFESSLKRIITDRNSFKYDSKELLSKNINPVKKITNLLNN